MKRWILILAFTSAWALPTPASAQQVIKLATLGESKSLEELAAFIKLYGQRNISVASELLPDRDR